MRDLYTVVDLSQPMRIGNAIRNGEGCRLGTPRRWDVTTPTSTSTQNEIDLCRSVFVIESGVQSNSQCLDSQTISFLVAVFDHTRSIAKAAHRAGQSASRGHVDIIDVDIDAIINVAVQLISSIPMPKWYRRTANRI